MNRQNQQPIAIRLDPELLAALDLKRKETRQSRSEFIRKAIYDVVKDVPGVSQDLVYPQDRVGAAKGGRPKKTSLTSVPGESKRKPA